MKINIGITDDQQLFLKSLRILIETFPEFTVVVEALNGKALLQRLSSLAVKPDIMLLDVEMPVLDGVKTATALSETYPEIKLVALSMKDDDTSILRMIRAGCCAYLLKDIDADELQKALLEIDKHGFYNADESNRRYRRLLRKKEEEEKLVLSDRQLQFLQLASSDLTYVQIAEKMHLSERTIDGYREQLFEKLNVQSRVGMVLEALRKNLITL